ncbi:ABC transporter permease subunit [Arsenicicoccus sp. oral taxon 190]|uniref:ABC transporter permease subunit n=1 Tax=Arsenicicoccus sp. oral taxon 190 TaxID=1658671 RepID=UPI000679EFFF|nr:ABC transporter permease subunit [Arsenicicoccus sp. oral taxon 190]AKT50610.1 hypothetical protein ADJ73_03545 [Arsenicicoccus sp. oral taxon 190]
MNPTIIRLAFSSLLGRTRSLGLLALPLVLLIICAVARFAGGETVSPDGPVGRAILAGLGLVVVVPLLALLVVTRLLGNEMDDGTIYYLLSKPIPRWHVVGGKLVAGIVTTLVLGAVPMVLASLLLDQGSVPKALGWGAGAAAASVAYCGLFMALSSMTKHAVVWGLMYLMIWEGVLGGLLGGVSWLSIGAWSTRIAAEAGSMSVLTSVQLGLTYALVGVAVVLLAGAGWASYRLRGLSLTGDD